MHLENVSDPTSEQEPSVSSFEHLVSDIERADVTVYEKLNTTNAKAAREEFLSDSSLVHPNNIYGNLDQAEVFENLAKLDAAESELTEAGIPDKQKHYLDLIIDDYRRANDFLAANVAYNSATTPEEKAEAAAYHREANEAYYGKADEDTFYALLQEKLDKIDLDKLRPEDKTTYESLLEAIGPIKTIERDRFKPQPETVARFSELIQAFFETPLSHIPKNQETFTPDEAASITNEILRDEFGSNTAYHALVAPERANASVDHADRLIIFPGSRPKGDYTRKDLESIIVHELGTHVYRAMNYEKHPLTALARLTWQ